MGGNWSTPQYTGYKLVSQCCYKTSGLTLLPTQHLISFSRLRHIIIHVYKFCPKQVGIRDPEKLHVLISDLKFKAFIRCFLRLSLPLDRDVTLDAEKC